MQSENACLRLRAVAEFLGAASNPGAARWWELKALRGLRGTEARLGTALGHCFGPDPHDPEFAFLALDLTDACGGKARDLKRSFVVLKPRAGRAAAVTFDVVEGAAPCLETEDPGPWRVEVWKRSPAEGLFLTVVQFLGRASGAPLPVGEVSSVDLAGVCLADRVVLFHADSRSARSAVSFSVEGNGALKHLVTGLAPGAWEIWWNGWLEDPQGAVEPRAGALYFEGPPGDYFLRRR